MRRTPAERLQAWVVTGPAGHLWSALADIAVLLARYGATWGGRAAQRRVAGAGRRPSARR